MPFTFKHGDRPLDDYTIQRAVGGGGFGEVYYSLSDGGREVALKYLKSNPQIELRGVSHCINLKSPHLVSIFDVKKNAHDEYFVIMEYCSGPSLRDLLIAEPNGFGPQKAAFFTREVAKGLSYLHDRGIVHRDLKPGNIFYDDGYVKIGDYGLSKFISVSRHSAQTASVGTVHYMAPEIGSGNYSKGVDIYALGVMLYEMLLGKVPFEGSSMAEVLMKHLTAQPAVDDLPEPFGRVIRKALQKDPKDRYQSADEMVDDLLSVDAVRNSLGEFSTMSLEGAVRHGGADRYAAGEPGSPMPSPNPPPVPAWARGNGGPGAGAAWDPRYAPPLPDRLAKKMEKVSRKLDKKIAKFSGRAEGAGGKWWNVAGPRAGAAHLQNMVALRQHAYRGRRKLLIVLMLIGMAVALGVVSGNTYRDVYGVAAAMTTVFMYLGLSFARPAMGWFGTADGPDWARKLLTLGVCAGPVALGSTPLLAEVPNHGLPFFLGLLAMCVFANWDKERDHGETGELSFGLAIWSAIAAMIWTNIMAAVTENSAKNVMFIAAGVCGICSLVMQAAAWSRASTRQRPDSAEPQPNPPGYQPNPAGYRPVSPDDTMQQLVARPVGYPAPASRLGANLSPGAAPFDPKAPVERWAVTRMFWGLVSFALMAGTIALILVPFILHESAYDDTTATIIGSIACVSALTFTLRKLSETRARGFARNWLRPFLVMIGLFGAGAITTGMIRHWFEYPDDARVGSIFGLMVSTAAFITGLFAPFSKRASAKPFLTGDPAGAIRPPTDGIPEPAMDRAD